MSIGKLSIFLVEIFFSKKFVGHPYTAYHIKTGNIFWVENFFLEKICGSLKFKTLEGHNSKTTGLRKKYIH